MRLVVLVACVVGVVIAWTATAAADEPAGPRFGLTYLSPPPGCPREEALRIAVVVALGYEPFAADAPMQMVVSIRPAHDGVRGRIEMWHTGGSRVGARELAAPSCAELTPALELALALAIDPLRAGTRPVPPPATPTPPQAPSPPPVVEPPPEPPPPPEREGLLDRVRLRVAFGVEGSIDSEPGPAFGLMGRVGFALPRWSLALELHGELPGSAAAAGGQVSASTMAAFLAPCVFHRIIAFCALGGAGGQEVAGSGFLASHASWVSYAALGLRVELTLAVSRLVAVLLRVDLLAPLTRTELLVGTERRELVYRSAAISNTFGVALSTR